jgi:hypothetical protein
MLDETSALHGNMPHTTRRRAAINLVSLSPLLRDSLHQCGVRWAVHGRQAGEAPRTTEAITENDNVAFFHQFFGLTNNPALAAFARTCHAPVSSISWVVTVKVPTSTPASTNHHADLEIRNIRVAGQTDLMVDVTVRYTFKGTGHNGQIQGQLRNPDNPDHILESAAPTRSVTRSKFIATRLVIFEYYHSIVSLAGFRVDCSCRWRDLF